MRFWLRQALLFAIILFLKATPSYAYSLLTHLAIVDAAWEEVFVPALKQKFPNATDEQLKQARSFAYGGSVAPDLGYNRHGNKLFSNLIHYVRTGDFIGDLLLQADDINEYAFALGVATHYYGDEWGHGMGVNLSVPLIFPRMYKKFGDTVTYADDRLSHLRTEFSFDVVQTAKENYTSKAYHDFIGFQISKTVLKRAFLKTYSIDLDEFFPSFEKAVGSFRWLVKDLMPQITRQAWKINKKEIRKLSPTVTRHSFIYRMRRPDYFGEFGKVREKTSIRAAVLSFVFRILPKIGRLRSLKFKAPPHEAQLLLTQSFDSTVFNYKNGIGKFESSKINFPNIDWDTGKKTHQYEYRLADQAYSDLVLKLKEKNFDTVSPALKENILSFYKSYDFTGIMDFEQWQKTTNAIEELKMKGITETK